MIGRTLEALVRGEDLSVGEARHLMGVLMSGELDKTQIAAILIALRIKGETVAEISGFAAAMREKAVSISPRCDGLVDTCGTGGDARNTFNVSTATALVAAAMGIPVAKHGNRAVSSQCGSADVLEALGVDLDLSTDSVAEMIERVGIGFLFAPRHHPAMKYAAPVRRELGIRTVFNLLGPLTNPASVRRQLLGVFDPDLTETLCRVLQSLGSEKAYVVHGLDGTDEVSICGESVVSALEDGMVRTFRFTPEKAGLARRKLSEISGGSAVENAAHIRSILEGDGGARRDAVLLNAGFVAVLADRAADVAEGVHLAREAIETGKARDLLEKLRRVSHELAGEGKGAV